VMATPSDATDEGLTPPALHRLSDGRAETTASISHPAGLLVSPRPSAALSPRPPRARASGGTLNFHSASLDPLAGGQEGIMGSWRPLVPGCLTSWPAIRSGRVRRAWFFRTVLAIRASSRRGCG